jgi:hypothetical protein
VYLRERQGADRKNLKIFGIPFWGEFFYSGISGFFAVGRNRKRKTALHGENTEETGT